MNNSEDDSESSHPSRASHKDPTLATSPTEEKAPTGSNRRRVLSNQPILPSAPPPRRSAPRPPNRVGPVPDAVRTERDQQIIEGRRRGWSYREIRERYALPEAESTLRGRYRTLVKSKEERVRRPTWREKDVQLLFAAVQAASKPKRGAAIRWKDITDYMVSKGASYPFSAYACRKKWEEEVEGGQHSQRSRLGYHY